MRLPSSAHVDILPKRGAILLYTDNPLFFTPSSRISRVPNNRAAGSSFPELAAEVVGCFIATDNSAGTGTVIGSAIYNQLVIIGGSLILSPYDKFSLEGLPLIRDLTFYGMAIAMIFVAFQDGEVDVLEASLLLSG